MPIKVRVKYVGFIVAFKSDFATGETIEGFWFDNQDRKPAHPGRQIAGFRDGERRVRQKGTGFKGIHREDDFGYGSTRQHSLSITGKAKVDEQKAHKWEGERHEKPPAP